MPRLTESQTEKMWLDRATVARVNPWYFLRYFVRTKDEHDETVTYKPFPAKAMYRIITRVVQEVPILFCDKSRQIAMTWTVGGLALHDSMFKVNRRQADQSKKQEDADGILERQRHIYKGLLEFKPLFEATGGWPEAKQVGSEIGTNTQLTFYNRDKKGDKTESNIFSIPQGKNIIPSHTWSWIFADEINLQPEADKGYGAAIPSCEKWIGVGTPYGKQWAYYVMNNLDPDTEKRLGKNKVDSERATPRIVPPENPAENVEFPDEPGRRWIEDKILNMPDDEFDAMPLEELVACMPGMRFWINHTGLACLRVHYSADPDKDPCTRAGRTWYDRERPKYTQSEWEQHMEISYESFAGRPVIRNWSRPIFVRNPKYDRTQPVHLSFDFGTTVCGCIFSQFIKIDGFNDYQLRLLDEIILRGSNTPELARETVQLLETAYAPAWERGLIKAYCDPAGNQGRETTSSQSDSTSIQILRTHGINPKFKKFSVMETTRLLETVFAMTTPTGEPRVILTDRCPYLIKCLAGGLRYPDDKVGLAQTRKIAYVKDDEYDHGGDMLRYMIAHLFTRHQLGGEQQKADNRGEYIRDKTTGRIKGFRRHSTRRVNYAR